MSLVHLNLAQTTFEHPYLSSGGIPDVQRTVASIVDHHVNTPVIADSENGAERDIRRSGIVSAADVSASRHLSSVAIPVAIESCRDSLSGCGKEDNQAYKNIAQSTNNHTSIECRVRADGSFFSDSTSRCKCPERISAGSPESITPISLSPLITGSGLPLENEDNKKASPGREAEIGGVR